MLKRVIVRVALISYQHLALSVFLFHSILKTHTSSAINVLECNDWQCRSSPRKAMRKAPRAHAVLCLPTEQRPSEGRGEILVRPEAIKDLMGSDSNFFMNPQPEGPASGEIGCLLLPIKHTNCAHRAHSMVSLCSGGVFMHV